MKLQCLSILTAFALVASTACATDTLVKPRCNALAHRALRMSPVPGGLGVNIHFYEGNDNDLRMLSEAGVGIVRMDVSWAGTEKAPGEYDFARYDRLIADLEERGIRLLFIIDYGNPLYDEGLAPHTDECRAAYARFCAALAKRYAGKDIIWELWNEPNIGFWKPKPNVDDYMAWCKAVVPAMREVDPRICIIAPATSGIPLDFLEACFSRGLLELVDGVSVHPYRSASQGPETAVNAYRELASLIGRYALKPRRGHYFPILSGEWGYSTTLLSRELQGKYLPRQWLSNTAHGIPISIWYDWHDDGRDAEEKEHNFGTVTWDYQAKPSYVAMRTLIGELEGFRCMGRIDVGEDDDYAVAFRRDKEYKLAIWTTGEPHEMNLAANVRGGAEGPQFAFASGVHHLGDVLSLPKGDLQPVDDAPRYLMLSDPAPTWLQGLPIRAMVARPVEAGKEGDVLIHASVLNYGLAPIDVTFDITSGLAQGAWERPLRQPVPPSVGDMPMWRGTITRRDRQVVPLEVSATIEGEDGAVYTVRGTLEAPVRNAISMQLAWRHDGLCVTAQPEAETTLKATLAVDVEGRPRVSKPVALAGSEGVSVQFEDIRLGADPVRATALLLDADGKTIAQTEPMTYQLVDTMAAPEGAAFGEQYRLWHEGDADREISLSGEITAAPGENPPFPRAARIDYDIKPGWCFWQLGPKEQGEMPHGQPKRIMLWVYGDDSGDHMRCRVTDSTGQTFQSGGGAMGFSGWQLVEMPLDGPMGSWGGAEDGVIHPPLRWTSYYLQDPARVASAGTTFVTGVVAVW